MLKQLIYRLARLRGLNIVPFSTRNQLDELLRLVRPIETGRPLVRIGGEGDGGYLVPDDLDGVGYCFSPGVEETASFESDLSRRGIRSFMIDASVDRPPMANPLFTFEKVNLGRRDEPGSISLETWIAKQGELSGDLILQMDVEGCEYDILLSTPADVLRRFRIMVVEFHELDRLSIPQFFVLVRHVFEKLSRDFSIIHIHPNNYMTPISIHGVRVPPIMEFTFLRKDRVINPAPRSDFPHPLDRPNVPDRPDYPLPPEWYS